MHQPFRIHRNTRIGRNALSLKKVRLFRVDPRYGFGHCIKPPFDRITHSECPKSQAISRIFER